MQRMVLPMCPTLEAAAAPSRAGLPIPAALLNYNYHQFLVLEGAALLGALLLHFSFDKHNYI